MDYCHYCLLAVVPVSKPQTCSGIMAKHKNCKHLLALWTSFSSREEIKCCYLTTVCVLIFKQQKLPKTQLREFQERWGIFVRSPWNVKIANPLISQEKAQMASSQHCTCSTTGPLLKMNSTWNCCPGTHNTYLETISNTHTKDSLRHLNCC